jgi:hypothetical protein
VNYQCGLGWASLIDPLIERCKAEGVQIRQIKEKFGTLRFYVDANASAELEAAIDAAEKASASICELCGAPGQLREGNWLKTRCDAHVETRRL